MDIDIGVLSTCANYITSSNANEFDLSYDNTISYTDFKNNFFENNYFHPKKDISEVELINYTINGISFNLLNEVIKSYEDDININNKCWDPLKKICLVKDLVCLEKITDFNLCNLKTSLKLTELDKIIEDLKNKGETDVTINIPILIKSNTTEIKDIIFNLKLNITGI